jgi:hypothetical protein
MALLNITNDQENAYQLNEIIERTCTFQINSTVDSLNQIIDIIAVKENADRLNQSVAFLLGMEISSDFDVTEVGLKVVITPLPPKQPKQGIIKAVVNWLW